MEIREVFEDVKEKIGSNGLWIAGGVLALVFILSYMRQSSNESSGGYQVVTGIASYPDTATNANVIIDTIQSSIDYSEKEIIDAMGVSDDNMKEFLEQNFESTNDYILNGFESQKEILEMNHDTIMGALDDTQSAINNSINKTEQLQSAVDTAIKNMNSSKPATSTSTTSKPATTTAPAVTYYTYKTKAGLNTNTSIVDALKAIGVDSSMANRKKIASANGISNYSGTYSQNVSLLSKLKAGQLKKI